MSKSPRLSPHTLAVLDAIIASGPGGVSGAAIARATGLASGTLYPILMRLEKASWLSSEWEEGDPRILGRPRRRLYTITTVGRMHVRAAALQFAPIAERLSWA